MPTRFGLHNLRDQQISALSLMSQSHQDFNRLIAGDFSFGAEELRQFGSPRGPMGGDWMILKTGYLFQQL